MKAAEFRKLQGLPPAGHDYQTHARVPHPKPKPTQVEALAHADEGQGSCNGRPILRITSFRVRLLDRDNLWGGSKAITDCIAAVGLIPGDAEHETDIRLTQEKVAHRYEERTEIEIQYPE